MRHACIIAGTLALLLAGVLSTGFAASTPVGFSTTQWTLVNVSGVDTDGNGLPEVTYTPPGKTTAVTVEPSTIFGKPFHFFVKGGTQNKLVVFYEGGGACWDFSTCGGYGIPLCKTTLTELAEMNSAYKDFLDPPAGTPYTSVMNGGTETYPQSPLHGWWMVFVPYATCDTHTGNNTITYTGPFGKKLVANHRGMANSLSVIKWISANFSGPDQLFIAGSSAGSVGAIASAPYYINLFPASRITMLGDAAMYTLTPYFEANALPNWKLDLMWPTFIPSLKSGPQLLYQNTIKGLAGMWERIVAYYATYSTPTRTFAEYTDSSDDVQQYYSYRVHRFDPNDKITLEAAAAEWSSNMLSYTSAMWPENSNYRYYIAPGSDHTILYDNPKVFSLEVTNSLENGKRVKFIDFLTGELSSGYPSSVKPSSGSLDVYSIAPSIVQGGNVTNVTITGINFASGATVTFAGGAGPAPTAVVTGVVDTNGTGILDAITAIVTTKGGGPPREVFWDVVVTQSSPNKNSGTLNSSTLVEGFVVTP